jgi:acetyl-CoA carboxylase carboxyltransferase component
VTDHYAVSDEHALSIARSIVANLNWTEGTKTFVSSCTRLLRMPRFCAYGGFVRCVSIMPDSSLPA